MTHRMASTAELTQCHICLEQFQKPRALPCVHTFCHLCLQEYINAYHSTAAITSGFECPVCRQKTRPPGNDVPADHTNWASLFPINHLIVSLMNGQPDVSGSHREESSTDILSGGATETTRVEVPAFVYDVEPQKVKEKTLSSEQHGEPSTSLEQQPPPQPEHNPPLCEYNPPVPGGHPPPPPFGHYPPPPFGHHPPPPFGHHPPPPFGHHPPPPFGHHPPPPPGHHHPRFDRPHSPPHLGHHRGHHHGHPGHHHGHKHGHPGRVRDGCRGGRF